MMSSSRNQVFNYAVGRRAHSIRARKIIALNDTSEPPCTACVRKGQNCYRHPLYSKCAYCTARRFTQEYCQSPEGTRPPKKKRIRGKSSSNENSKQPDTQSLHSSQSPGSSALEDDTMEEGLMALEDDSGRVTASSSDLAFLDGRITALEARFGQGHVQATASLEARFSALESRVATLSQTYGQLLTFVNELDRSIENPPPDADQSDQSGTVQPSFENHTTDLSPKQPRNGSSQTIHVSPHQPLSSSSHQVMTFNVSLGSGSEGSELKHTIFFTPGVQPNA